MTTEVMSIQGKHFIGNTLSGLGVDTFHGINPQDGELLEGLFYEAVPLEMEHACEKAANAFQSYALWEGSRRSKFLKSIAKHILELGDSLLHRAHEETGLPLARLQGERGRTVNQLSMFADLVEEGSWVSAKIDHAIPNREPLPKPDLRQMLVPLGPVAVFGASNFPLAFSVAGGDTASAFAAGCPVVFKAHAAHPGTSELVASAIMNAVDDVKAPEGIFSMLQGTDLKINVSLVKNSNIKAVGFTGSFTGGKALMDAVNSRPDPIPIFAEMGSNNPIFLLPQAVKNRSESIAQGLIQSLTNAAGQFCTGPGLIFMVKGDETDVFIKNLAGLVSACETGSTVHSGVKDNYDNMVNEKNVESQVELIGQSEGGDKFSETEVRPALLKSTGSNFLNRKILQKELFGPGALVVECKHKEEMYQVASSLEGNLTGTIHGEESELKKWNTLQSILQNKVGRLIFNGYPTGVEVCPSMQHGGPFPASSDSRTTSVGTGAITRFARPVSFQSCPDDLLPAELKNSNPNKVWRLVDGEFVK